MSPISQHHTHKGFSLIELLIVVVIISLVYALGFSNFTIRQSKPKALTPMNLKETIIKSEFFSEHTTLMCINKCRQCYLRQNVSSAFDAYENKIDLHNIQAYTIDGSNALRRIEYERYQDEKICLVMDFFPNGSSTQIILKDDKGAYFLPAFFGKPKRFDSPEDAKDYWLAQSRAVSNSGDFY
jgi:prepilin-type N-terminal cleavage/methylation domain-containing protein